MPHTVRPQRQGIRPIGTPLVTSSQTYVSTKDLMARMGQDSPRAALIYQHASRQADQTIADKLSALIEDANSTKDHPDDDDENGPAGALVPVG